MFWLYSFCLRGLDGQDVTLVSDKLLVEDSPLADYIYDFDIEGYDTPVHIELKRKKTAARTFTLLINAYPTLSINELLKKVIRINRPDEVNEDDGLKLFKWDRLTNKRKWDLYVTRENKRTLKATELIQKGSIQDFGNLMYQTHQELSKNYEVSCAELDFLVD